LRTAALAIDTGIPLINFHPPAWMGLELKFWRWFHGIRNFQTEIGQNQVLITIENMPCTGSFKVNPYLLGQTGKMIGFMQERNLFLTFDTAHMGPSKANFLHDFISSTIRRMRNIHFSDYGYGRSTCCPGTAFCPDPFSQSFAETGYDSTLTLELPPRISEHEDGIREGMAEIFAYLCRETRFTAPAATRTASAGEKTGVLAEDWSKKSRASERCRPSGWRAGRPWSRRSPSTSA
jgi:hypothetical protein